MPSSKTTILGNYWKVLNSALQVLTFASDGICQPASFYSPHTSVLNNRPAVQFLAHSHLFSWYLHLSQNISFEEQHNNEQPRQEIRKQILVGGQQIQNGKLFASKANNQLKVSKLFDIFTVMCRYLSGDVTFSLNRNIYSERLIFLYLKEKTKLTVPRTQCASNSSLVMGIGRD